MFAYCGNQPTGRIDTSGQYYCKIAFDAFAPFDSQLVNFTGVRGGGSGLCWGAVVTPSKNKTTSNTFGAGVVQSNSYACFSWDTLFVGVESGLSTSGTMHGDISKPVSFYAETASEWWKVNEYKVGVQFNLGDGGCGFAVGFGETTLTLSCGDGRTFEIMGGANKFGITIYENANFGNHTADRYTHLYIRTLPTAGLLALLVFYPELVPLGGAILGGAPT